MKNIRFVAYAVQFCKDIFVIYVNFVFKDILCLEESFFPPVNLQILSYVTVFPIYKGHPKIPTSPPQPPTQQC